MPSLSLSCIFYFINLCHLVPTRLDSEEEDYKANYCTDDTSDKLSAHCVKNDVKNCGTCNDVETELLLLKQQDRQSDYQTYFCYSAKNHEQCATYQERSEDSKNIDNNHNDVNYKAKPKPEFGKTCPFKHYYLLLFVNMFTRLIKFNTFLII